MKRVRSDGWSLKELGEDFLVTTPKLLTRAVRRDVIRLTEIPELRVALARNRFALGELEVERE